MKWCTYIICLCTAYCVHLISIRYVEYWLWVVGVLNKSKDKRSENYILWTNKWFPSVQIVFGTNMWNKKYKTIISLLNVLLIAREDTSKSTASRDHVSKTGMNLSKTGKKPATVLKISPYLPTASRSYTLNPLFATSLSHRLLIPRQRNLPHSII